MLHVEGNVLGWLYTFAFCECFSRNTPRNTKHFLYTFRMKCKFRTLLVQRKNKPQNPLTFCVNADPGAKCCEMPKAKKGTQNAKYPAIHFLFFVFCAHFHIFRDKCVAGLSDIWAIGIKLSVIVDTYTYQCYTDKKSPIL